MTNRVNRKMGEEKTMNSLPLCFNHEKPKLATAFNWGITFLKKDLRVFFFILFFSFIHGFLYAQQLIRTELSLVEVLQLAKKQSTDALIAKHKFRASYWEFQSYEAVFKPKLSLSMSIPEYYRTIKKYQNPDGSYTYVEDNVNSATWNLYAIQNVVPTGGQIFASSNLTRLDVFGISNSTSYLSTPISIGYRQPILFYNEFKWQKKIEPLKYEEAKKNLISDFENIALKAVDYFFDLLLAQQNNNSALINYSNADTLYQISLSRYKIGMISENELMQMRLNMLNSGSSVNFSLVDIEIKKAQLSSFLGFNENADIYVTLPYEIPAINIELEQALKLAQTNNPEIVAFERQLIEASQNIAKAKTEKGLQASLFAQIGYTQQASEFNDVYRNPQGQQSATIGLNIPILDGGLGKGRFKMAQSSQQVIISTIDQARMDFKHKVYLAVMVFNLQDEQIAIASVSDSLSQKRYNIIKRQFLSGATDVLYLNVASSEKDAAKKQYINALRNYWTYFYNLRKVTLYDFLNEKPIEIDFDVVAQ